MARYAWGTYDKIMMLYCTLKGIPYTVPASEGWYVDDDLKHHMLKLYTVIIHGHVKAVRDAQHVYGDPNIMCVIMYQHVKAVGQTCHL